MELTKTLGGENIMDGKTFVRAFYFAESHHHGWADTLLSEAACEDMVAGPFARAAWRARNTWHTAIPAERMAMEERMASLADGFEAQKALIEAVDRLRKAEGRENPGIFAGDSFYERIPGELKDNGEIERNGGFNYDHVTGSKRLEVWVDGDNVDFIVSRSGVSELLCVSVSLADGGFRVYSGESNSFLSEDHDACVRRWEKYLCERHVFAMTGAVRSFFGAVGDRELCLTIEKAVYAEAAEVFRRQANTVELSYWNHRTHKGNAILLSEDDPFVSVNDKNIPLSNATRIPLFQEVQRIDTYDRDTPAALIPFDYSPSSPDALFFRECFGLPEEGVRHEDMRGTLMLEGDSSRRYPDGGFCIAMYFATGVTPDDIKRHAARHIDEEPQDVLLAGLSDAVAEREGKGSFLAEQHSVMTKVNYPEQSLEAVKAAYERCCIAASPTEEISEEPGEDPEEARGL